MDCYSYRTSIVLLESLTTDAYVFLMQLQWLIRNALLCQEALGNAHKHTRARTHTASLLVEMPARVLGAKMRTVIGAEPGSMH